MLKLRSEHRCFSGSVRYYSHQSKACKGPMNFSIFVPTLAEKQACPVIYFLAGLSSSDENFMVKAGAERIAEELGLFIVAPDTSPRARGIALEKEHWTFGEGASFYVNATEEPWAPFYSMYDYIVFELPSVIEANFATTTKSIMGHSMGGHGALVIGLRNPQNYASISAFAPICAPTRSPWGQNAFERYLGPDHFLWSAYDTVEIIKRIEDHKPILIDQGGSDPYLQEELRLDDLEQAAREWPLPLTIRRQPGYDHGYYFIATFIESHLRFHRKYLG